MFESAKIVTILGLVLSLIPFSVASEQKKALRFGSVAMDIPAVMHKRLTPLTTYLSKELNREVVLDLSPNMKDAIKKVSSGEVDFAYLTPVAYIRSHEAGNTQLIAKTVTQNKGSFQLMIVVREDSDIKNPSDLFGRSFAFGDKAALLQRAAVLGAGVPLEKLGKYDFLGHYDNIVRAVLNKEYDAGILKDTKAYKWEKRGIRIVYSTPQLPPYNIAARKMLDSETVTQLKKAFLKLDSSNPKHKPVIQALSSKYSGFQAVTNKDYDVVRKLTLPFTKSDN